MVISSGATPTAAIAFLQQQSVEHRICREKRGSGVESNKQQNKIHLTLLIYSERKKSGGFM